MLNFPKSAAVGQPLYKEKLIDKLTLSAALKESLKDDVRRFTITHELSEKSINIPKGERVSAVFVIEVALKRRDVDNRLIEATAKQLERNILFVLRHENDGQLALFYGKLYKTEWMNVDRLTADISGLNFDEVWDGFIAQIALNVKPEVDAAPVAEQLARQEEIAKLKREIERLESKARSERQPKKKYEIVGRVNELKKKLEGLG